MKRSFMALLLVFGLIVATGGPLVLQFVVGGPDRNSKLLAASPVMSEGEFIVAGKLTGQHFGPIVSEGSYAYIGAGGVVEDKLLIVDVTNPAIPAIKGTLPLSDRVYDLKLMGSLLFVANGGADLQIVDVSKPASPTIVGSLSHSGNALGIDLANGYAYVAAGFDGLRIVNVANPMVPAEVSSYAVPFARDVAIVGTLAYVGDDGISSFDGKLHTLDIASPESPSEVSTLDIPGASHLEVSDGYAYVTYGVVPFNGGLQIINVTDPENPSLATTYPTSPRYAGGLAIRDGFAFTTSSNNFGGLMEMLDISDPEDPMLAAVYSTQEPSGIAATDSYVYLTEWNRGLLVLSQVKAKVYLPVIRRDGS